MVVTTATCGPDEAGERADLARVVHAHLEDAEGVARAAAGRG